MTCSVDPHLTWRSGVAGKAGGLLWRLWGNCLMVPAQTSASPVPSILSSWPGWSAGGPGGPGGWLLQPGGPGAWRRQTSVWEMRRPVRPQPHSSSLHILTGAGGEEPLQSEATLCGNQTQLTQHSKGPRYQFTNKKHLQLRQRLQEIKFYPLHGQ